MHAAFESLWQFWIIAVSSIFFLVDPFAAIPTFLAIAVMRLPSASDTLHAVLQLPVLLFSRFLPRWGRLNADCSV